uniref:Phage protein n=1 Tax=Rhabditophanes sp. KR3021 TaxID=114890 RepID=A0AC35TQM4_9BILA
MPDYVDFDFYDEWYSIFYDDDFTPDCSTYYIVRNAMLDWDLKLWEKANEFLEKYPKAVAYGEMPNVNLDVLQEDCIPENKEFDYCSNYSKNEEKLDDEVSKIVYTY